MSKFIKSLMLVLSLVVMVSAVGCGGGDNSTSIPDSTQQESSNNGSSDNGGDSSNSSGDGQTAQYTITFKQSGQEDVYRYVEEGEDLTDIPACVEKRGYTVTWDRTDFTDISTNIVVNAVEDANEYKIYYQDIIEDYIPWGAELEYDAEKEMYYAVVEYDATYTLVVCKNGQYITTTQWKKDGVVYAATGVYQEIKDITLSPVWEDSRENEEDWSEWYE